MNTAERRAGTILIVGSYYDDDGAAHGVGRNPVAGRQRVRPGARGDGRAPPPRRQDQRRRRARGIGQSTLWMGRAGGRDGGHPVLALAAGRRPGRRRRRAGRAVEAQPPHQAALGRHREHASARVIPRLSRSLRPIRSTRSTACSATAGGIYQERGRRLAGGRAPRARESGLGDQAGAALDRPPGMRPPQRADPRRCLRRTPAQAEPAHLGLHPGVDLGQHQTHPSRRQLVVGLPQRLRGRVVDVADRLGVHADPAGVHPHRPATACAPGRRTGSRWRSRGSRRSGRRRGRARPGRPARAAVLSTSRRRRAPTPHRWACS